MKPTLNALPTKRQVQWQTLEFYGFIHFGMNTFTNSEWGEGVESPSLFNPTELDCRQWVKSMKAAGMKGAILTCKHHDGFCLWPSAVTEYSVKNSPYQEGQGDVVKEFAEACQEEGLKFGIYLSPWDRHETCYGKGEAYNDFFIQQLEELLTGYGEIFEVWFDGANGESEGKKQDYDWERYYELIRRHQPEAVIAVCGPDVRWVGNEAGQARKNEWSVVPEALMDIEKIAAHSQQVDDGLFAKRLSSSDEDLGSRKALENYQGRLVWYPAEVNTSIRPGWFYHEEENHQVKSAKALFGMYLKAVGGNSTFLLNLAPSPKGKIKTVDVKTLVELGELIEQLNHPVETKRQVQKNGDIYLESSQEVPFNCLLLGEAIEKGQQVEAFRVSIEENNEWVNVYEGESIGYKRLLLLPLLTTKKVKIELIEYRELPEIDKVDIFLLER